MIPRPHRRGFTLVEMLVVMFIIMLLFGLGVAFLPGVYQQKEVVRGAELLQQWLVTARQRAKRDKVPYGLRLLPAVAPTQTGHADKLQFIVRPEDFSGGTLSGQQNTATIAGAALNNVQAEDYLEVNGSGLGHRIVSVAGNQLNLFGNPPSTAFPNPIQGTTQYRIVRQPRVLQGETVLEFPSNVAIDLALCSTNGLTPLQFNAPYDVLFSPSGSLTGKSVGSDKIIFYVRNTKVGPTAGAPLLVCIYTRTGFVAVHPVDIKSNNRYTYTMDPRSSGM